jgi:hypothetical protein
MTSILKVDTIQDQSGNNIINESADTITIGASGDTITVPSGATMTVPNGGLSGQNYPAFFVRKSANQSVTTGVITKVVLDVEDLDTDSCFDISTNYRFTPTTAGKYFFFACGRGIATSGTLNYVNVMIRKNGTAGVGNTFVNSSTEQYTSPGNSDTASPSIILNMNGTTDYVELYMQVGGTSPNISYESNGNQTFFGGYRIGA